MNVLSCEVISESKMKVRESTAPEKIVVIYVNTLTREGLFQMHESVCHSVCISTFNSERLFQIQM